MTSHSPDTGEQANVIDSDDDSRFIVAAAIKQGKMICSVPKPGRHHDVIRAMATAGIPIPINGEQGFLTSDGIFVGRKRAKIIASLAGQILREVGADGVPFERNHPDLFSEDVW